eukprot:NODE_2538_length_1152_cov_38.190244_g2419_i0.p1 GENE.NODE_2538_length_1152_cov_38.190244_g2419_i0~~NODE_2538_length_1152_cov_38.190244_g2419_i0.p1  ORF type:complete len:339 (+),score=27.89 NODE_2538_length_1152_cov_38.190244_g2419_i0:83-1099(+)
MPPKQSPQHSQFLKVAARAINGSMNPQFCEDAAGQQHIGTIGNFNQFSSMRVENIFSNIDLTALDADGLMGGAGAIVAGCDTAAGIEAFFQPGSVGAAPDFTRIKKTVVAAMLAVAETYFPQDALHSSDVDDNNVFAINLRRVILAFVLQCGFSGGQSQRFPGFTVTLKTQDVDANGAMAHGAPVYFEVTGTMVRNAFNSIRSQLGNGPQGPTLPTIPRCAALGCKSFFAWVAHKGNIVSSWFYTAVSVRMLAVAQRMNWPAQPLTAEETAAVAVKDGSPLAPWTYLHMAHHPDAGANRALVRGVAALFSHWMQSLNKPAGNPSVVDSILSNPLMTAW